MGWTDGDWSQTNAIVVYHRKIGDSEQSFPQFRLDNKHETLVEKKIQTVDFGSRLVKAKKTAAIEAVPAPTIKEIK
jgi:hypothetical protein